MRYDTEEVLKKCGCSDCRNFLINYDSTFPLEFKHLLNELGVDYRKAAEVYRSHSQNSRHYYGGWFHARGTHKGPAALPQSNNGTMKMHDLNSDFSIGFWKSHALNIFSSNEHLIQIEFWAALPWTLDENEPD